MHVIGWCGRMTAVSSAVALQLDNVDCKFNCRGCPNKTFAVIGLAQSYA